MAPVVLCSKSRRRDMSTHRCALGRECKRRLRAACSAAVFPGSRSRSIARDNAALPSRTSTTTPPPPRPWFASKRRGSLTSMLGNQLVDLNASRLPDFLSSSLTQIDSPVHWRSLVRARGLAGSPQSRSEELLRLIPRHRVIIFRVD